MRGHDDLGPGLLDEVVSGVYSYVQPDGTWFINNTGFVIGDDHIVSIDTTSTERRTRAYIEAIRSVSELPVTKVLNTHHHADHTHGNYLFPGATIISHERCREVMIETGIPDYRAAFPDVEWGALEFVAPSVTFTGEMRLHVGEMTIELADLGYVAHTDGDVLAWIPERGVLFTGDLIFHGGTPFSLFGSVRGTLDSMDAIAAYGAAHVIPGHGPAFSGDDIAVVLDQQRDYLRFVQTVAADGLAAGRSPLEQAQATNLGDFGRYTDSERIVGNLHVAYNEASGSEEPTDVATAIGEMITYNGGKPLRCVA